jgi:cytidine deaminase
VTPHDGLDLAVAPFPTHIADRLRALALTPGRCAVVGADEAAAWAERLGATPAQLMLRLLPWAASFASAPVSRFRVGALARGGSGALYPGANVELAGEALAFTVHAEQSAVANAWLHGETAITAFAVDAAPCGHCRQFLYELDGAANLIVHVVGAPPAPLTALLPAPFGPRDLGVDGGLLRPGDQPLSLREPSDDPVVLAALAAASASYAPYSKSFAGAALRTRDGAIYAGRYAENAAFNPSLAPLAAALVHLRLCGADAGDVVQAVLVERAGAVSQRAASAAVLAAVSTVPLAYAVARLSGADPAP